MAERVALKPKPASKAKLELLPPSHFMTTGSLPLDLVLAGGWGLGRISNVVGDRSSGKTLLAIEAAANFASRSGIENIRYVESEAAFDEQYAAIVGMPAGLKTVDDIQTVEELFEDMGDWLGKRTSGKPCLYIVDSLDALSDDGEMKRDIDKGSYGAEKAKLMSQLFRRMVKPIEKANCHVMIISQLRDKIGVMFGEKQTRSGGRALNFYASQIIWLSEIGKIKKKVLEVERISGVHVRVRNKKNKLGPPFRECELVIQFNYGVDDELSILEWINDNKAPWPENEIALSKVKTELDKARKNHDRDRLQSLSSSLRNAMIDHWAAIEDALQPPLRKYE